MKSRKSIAAFILVTCMLIGCITVPGVFASTTQEAGILVADSANRTDFDPHPEKPDHWNLFYVGGGSAQYWLWKTMPGDPAVFRFDLPDNAVSFEPYFEGENEAQAFTIYASKDGSAWVPVAGMNGPYEKNRIYNSTTGLSNGSYASGNKTTEGRAFDVYNQENAVSVLTGNPTRTVYLKVVPSSSDMELRSFGLTYVTSDEPLPGDGEPEPDPYKHGIKVANSANRSDYDTNAESPDYWQKYYVSGGSALYWLWKTFPDNRAVFRFNLPNGTVAFEPYFEGEDTAQPFKILASKNGTDWLEVARMDEVYEKNRVYNSTVGLTDGAYASGNKTTAGHAFSALNEANIAAILENNPKKIVYLQVEAESDIALRAFGITFKYTGDEDPADEDDEPGNPTEPGQPSEREPYKDPYDDHPDYRVKTEYRIAVAGQTFDEKADGFKTYFEEELAEGELGGEVLQGHRVLKGLQSVVFKLEIDPNAVFLKLDGWDASAFEGHNGSQLFNVSLWSEEAEDFQSIADCGTEFGLLLSPRMTWNKFDNTWGREANNEYIVTNAPINENGKKEILLRLIGQFNNSYDGMLMYKSFLVQTVVPVETDKPSDPDNGNGTDPGTDPGSKPAPGTDPGNPQTGDLSPLFFAAPVMFAAALTVFGKRRRVRGK